MKNVLFPLLLMLTLTACKGGSIREAVRSVAESPVDTTGYDTRVVPVASFTSVVVDCLADITYVQTDSAAAPHIVLQAPAAVLGLLDVQTGGAGPLCISLSRHSRLPENVVPVIKIYAPHVTCFTLNGGKILRLGRSVAQSPVTIALCGAGLIKCDSLCAPDVVATLDGAGAIELRGLEAGSIRATLNGTGNILLDGHYRDEAVTHINGLGEIDTQSLVRKR